MSIQELYVFRFKIAHSISRENETLLLMKIGFSKECKETKPDETNPFRRLYLLTFLPQC